jgi:hypothetical protein
MAADASKTSPLGAYGLLLPDLAVTGRLNLAPPTWKNWRVHITVDRTANIADFREAIENDSALIVHSPMGAASLNRIRSETELRLLDSPTLESLSHPLLSSTGIVANHWHGRPSFHAGAFVYGGYAWGILGNRGDGKSTILGWLNRAGYDVLSDDLLVIDSGNALAGPRCLDLRDEAASYFGLGDYLGVVGTRERWRVGLSQVSPEVPLAGWIGLNWGAEPPNSRSVPLSLRIPRLAAARAMLTPIATDPISWLDFAALPFFELTRPRQWSALDQTMDILLRALTRLTAG